MRTRPNGGKLSLQEAVVHLIQTQAAFVSEMAEINRRHDQLRLETRRNWDAIEKKLGEIDQIKIVLDQMREMLLQLPEAVRQKIGFKPK